MLNHQQQEYLRRMTTALQIITAAMAMGVLIFAVVIIFVVFTPPEENSPPILTTVGAAASIAAIVAAVVVPRLLVGTVRKSLVSGKAINLGMASQMPAGLGEVGSLLGVYQVKTIVGIALLEGTAFLNLIAYLLEGQRISLICAAVLLAAIFFKFPTRGAIENWVLDERKSIEELRAFED